MVGSHVPMESVWVHCGLHLHVPLAYLCLHSGKLSPWIVTSELTVSSSCLHCAYCDTEVNPKPDDSRGSYEERFYLSVSGTSEIFMALRNWSHSQWKQDVNHEGMGSFTLVASLGSKKVQRSSVKLTIFPHTRNGNSVIVTQACTSFDCLFIHILYHQLIWSL